MATAHALGTAARGEQREAPEPPQPVDEKLFRRVMGLFATGITVITTEIDEHTYGMTANAFMAGSLDPPLCVISVGNGARLCDRLRQSARFGVSFLGQHQRHLSNHFAGRGSSSVQPQFERLDGMPVLAHALATIAADVVDTAVCGDHTLFLGRITRMEAGHGEPLLFHGGRYARIGEDDSPAQIDPPMFW